MFFEPETVAVTKKETKPSTFSSTSTTTSYKSPVSTNQDFLFGRNSLYSNKAVTTQLDNAMNLFHAKEKLETETILREEKNLLVEKLDVNAKLVQNLRAENAALSSRNALLESMVNELRQKLATAQKQADTSKATADNLKLKVSEMTEQLAVVTTAAAALPTPPKGSTPSVESVRIKVNGGSIAPAVSINNNTLTFYTPEATPIQPHESIRIYTGCRVMYPTGNSSLRTVVYADDKAAFGITVHTGMCLTGGEITALVTNNTPYVFTMARGSELFSAKLYNENNNKVEIIY
jgi:hypothetical protein